MQKLSLYIHWPFCKKKCPYCNFNSHLTDKFEYHKWLKAYTTELEYFFKKFDNQFELSTIFIGGGTPSLMSGELIYNLIAKLKSNIKFSDSIEITMEANPTSIEANNFKSYYDAGVNRLSLGIQSLNADNLKFLGRQHNIEETLNAINITKSIFDNFSIDLIYSLPNQTLKEWKNELVEALKFNSPHLSLYQLTIEKGTAFYNMVKDKEFIMPSDDRQADYFEATDKLVANHNIYSYEISNFAKPGFECKHNLNYWNYNYYLGIGPGAHSRVPLNNKFYALMNYNLPQKYLDNINNLGHAIQQKTYLPPIDALKEKILMGLRLNKGINYDFLENHFQIPVNEIIPKILLDENLIEINDNYIQIASRHRLITDAIIKKITDSFDK